MDALQELSELSLENISKEGKVPTHRIKDAKAALDIFNNLLKADEPAAINRTRVQAMLDGVAPYSDQALRASGQAFRTNLNFGEGEKYLEQAMSAYVDLINSVEVLVRIQTLAGDPSQRMEWSRIMSEEYSQTLRDWTGFNYQYLNLCNHFIAHGVGINYHDDDYCWHWKSTGMGDIVVPRQTRACEEDIEVACAQRDMSVTELYSYIENEDAAKTLGWDVGAVKKAISQACSGLPDTDSWEKIQAQIKNNDLWTGGKASRVQVVHLWVKEFDGSVTHLIVDRKGESKEFLRKAENVYRKMSDGFTFFTYGIGTNGTYHSIRGLGHKIFQHIQLSNRIRSQATDNAMLAGSPMLQPDDERALENLAFNYFGPFAIVPPNVKFVDRAVPNVSQTMMPILQDLSRLADERTGQYSTSGVFSGGSPGGGSSRKTRFEVAAHLEEASKLTVTAFNLFYNPWDRFHVGVARRFHNPDYPSSAPGYDAVLDYRERCLSRGVPEEALNAVDAARTRAVRAVGNGSQAARTVGLQQLNELMGTFDEEGRHNLVRDQVAALVGQEAADRYVPARPDVRVPMDAKHAQLENVHLQEGAEIEVFPNEAHLVHLQIHVPAMEKVFGAVEQGAIPLEEAYMRTNILFQHSVVHLEQVQQDPTVVEKVREYNQRLQQLSELIVNGQKQLMKRQREKQQAAEQAAAEGAVENTTQPQNTVTPEQQEKLLEHRLKLQMMQEKHQVEMMIRLQKHEQERQLQDARAAKDVRDFLR